MSETKFSENPMIEVIVTNINFLHIVPLKKQLRLDDCTMHVPLPTCKKSSEIKVDVQCQGLSSQVSKLLHNEAQNQLSIHVTPPENEQVQRIRINKEDLLIFFLCNSSAQHSLS
jgi:hypothetical protein